MMTDAELAVLSLVAEGPQHDYQLQQAIESRGVRDWTAIGFSSVFYLLNKLEKDGLLASTLSPDEHGPARKVYELTQAGRGVLQTTLVDLLSTPREAGGGFALGLANLHLLRPEQVRRALDAYEAELRERVADLNRLRSEQAEHSDRPLHVLALFDYSLHMAIAELEWLGEFRQAWEAQAPPAPPRRSAMRVYAPSDPIIDTRRTRPSAPTEPLSPKVEDASEDDDSGE